MHLGLDLPKVQGLVALEALPLEEMVSVIPKVPTSLQSQELLMQNPIFTV